MAIFPPLYLTANNQGPLWSQLNWPLAGWMIFHAIIPSKSKAKQKFALFELPRNLHFLGPPEHHFGLPMAPGDRFGDPSDTNYTTTKSSTKWLFLKYDCPKRKGWSSSPIIFCRGKVLNFRGVSNWLIWNLPPKNTFDIRLILLMEEIPNNHLGCIKPLKKNGYLPYQLVSRISEPSTVSMEEKKLPDFRALGLAGVFTMATWHHL